jgi:hypothetical protein
MLTALAFVVLTGVGRIALGQADQGSITGVVQDPSGAVIANASVTLTGVDTGQVLKTSSDGAGIYSFPPVRIGRYSITAGAPGFETTMQTNLQLNVQDRLNVMITLKPGATTESITVTGTEAVMQTQESSVGQVLDTKAIDTIPLNGRNWVYIAQLSAGAVPPPGGGGTRATGTGDFNANGQRAEQNNFMLDGVDNNSSLADFFNGQSFVAQPPPDALAEFKVQTSDYSAEFGHSGGAVVNASLKSGTNSIHGSAWEYVRNTAFDARDWEATSVPVYHENQFGATLGLPIIRNKLFFFGDVQANRIAFTNTNISTVPTALERAGNFSELFSPSLTGKSAPIQLYYQNPITGPQPFPNNNLNSMSGVTLNKTALALLNLYPKPNTNNGLLYSNYIESDPEHDDTTQWDTRVDWNISAKDTAYAHFDYWHEPNIMTLALGSLNDKYMDILNLTENFMFSEAHVFTPTTTNEFRLAYGRVHAGAFIPDANNPNYAASFGLGGIPNTPPAGGLPGVSISGISGIGQNGYSPIDERENEYQILDTVTKIVGNHTVRAGVMFQSIRFTTLEPPAPRGDESYTGEYTSDLNAANTGWGVADFLLDSQNNATLANVAYTGDARWYDAAYAQDDWRITHKLTANLGVRWDYFQPYKDVGAEQSSFYLTSAPSINTMTGMVSASAAYLVPTQVQSYVQSIFAQTSNAFPNLLAKDNIALHYTSNQYLVNAQKANLGPRVGLEYSLNGKTVIRAGYGLFYGGLENSGFYANLGQNYPFRYVSSFVAQSCYATYCPTDGITIANGFSTIIANGFAGDVSNLALRGSPANATTPYTESYNLSVERDAGKGLFATIGWVGDGSHHLIVDGWDPNAPLALQNPGNSSQAVRPLPDFGTSGYTFYVGASNYNGLQAKLEKRYSHGNSLLATYTWSHAFDDAPPMMTGQGNGTDAQYRNPNLIPIKMEYANSSFDTRQRFSFAAMYDLPFGSGRKFLNNNSLLNTLVGGWSTTTTFAAQTGNPFSVLPTGIVPATGGQVNLSVKAEAVRIGNPSKPGGTWTSPDPNIQVTCATTTRVRAHWINPCAFENPWEANDWTYEPSTYIPTGPSDPHYSAASQPVYVTGVKSATGFLGGRRNDAYGPGYERVNMSLFKLFTVYHEQTLQFRSDFFNLLNTPSLDQPSDKTIDNTAGMITGPRFFQNYTPDARFIQLSLRYTF